MNPLAGVLTATRLVGRPPKSFLRDARQTSCAQCRCLCHVRTPELPCNINRGLSRGKHEITKWIGVLGCSSCRSLLHNGAKILHGYMQWVYTRHTMRAPRRLKDQAKHEWAGSGVMLNPDFTSLISVFRGITGLYCFFKL